MAAGTGKSGASGGIKHKVSKILRGEKVGKERLTRLLEEKENPNPHDRFTIERYSDEWGFKGKHINASTAEVEDAVEEIEAETIIYRPALATGYELEVRGEEHNLEIKTGERYSDPLIEQALGAMNCFSNASSFYR